MIEAQKAGKIRSIGVSNMTPKIWQKWADKGIFNTKMPAVNQVEFNPYFQQKELRQIMAQNHVTLEAWAPFAEGKHDIFNNEVIAKIGQKYGKSNGQVILRWLLQRGIVAIPKSVHRERIAENFDVFNFQLDDEDIQAMNSLNKNESQFFDHRDPAAIESIFGTSLKALRK